MTTLNEALDARFTDVDEMRDIAKYGCIGGVNGFIHSSELAAFYDQHEEEIEDILEDLDIEPNDLVSDPECWSMQELKERAVWVAVENYCYQKTEN